LSDHFATEIWAEILGPPVGQVNEAGDGGEPQKSQMAKNPTMHRLKRDCLNGENAFANYTRKPSK
jgi:hypothetical protein